MSSIIQITFLKNVKPFEIGCNVNLTYVEALQLHVHIRNLLQ